MHRGMLAAHVLAALASLGSSNRVSNKVYMFNNSRVVPGNPSLLEYDLADPSKYTVVASLNDAQDNEVDAACICGRTWYGVWNTVPNSDGITAIDLDTGAYKIYDNGGVNGQMFHALACGSEPGSLFALAINPNGGQAQANFSLVRYDLDSETTTVVGDFPKDSKYPTHYAGFDNGFHFSADGKHLYASFPDNSFEPKIRGGSFHVMNTASGQVEEKYSFPYGSGMPYGMYPTGNDAFKGAFLHTRSQKLSLCDVTKPAAQGGSLHVDNCIDAPWLSSGSAPMPVCSDGLLYSVEQNIGSHPGSSQNLTVVNLDDGNINFQVDLATVIPGTLVGAVAC